MIENAYYPEPGEVVRIFAKRADKFVYALVLRQTETDTLVMCDVHQYRGEWVVNPTNIFTKRAFSEIVTVDTVMVVDDETLSECQRAAVEVVKTGRVIDRMISLKGRRKL